MSPRAKQQWMASKIEQWPLERLQPYEHNPKTHPERQLERLEASIRRYGFTNPILVTKRDGVVAGHGRLAAARRMGLAKVPVIVLPNLTEAQRRELVIADNKLADSPWDEELLAQELAAIEAAGGDMDLLGFDQAELDALLAEEPARERGSELEEPAVPEPPAKPAVRSGDLWVLGRHRLLCGDATDTEAVARLVGKATPTAVVTDPPYGVNMEGVHNDSPEGLGALFAGVFGAMPDSVQLLAAFQNPRHMLTLIDTARAGEWAFERALWEYETTLWMFRQVSKAYPWRSWLPKSDAILLFSRGQPAWPEPHSYSADTYVRTNLERQVLTGIHPTIKPLAVIVDLVTKLCPDGGTLYEPFNGSGTAIMACEMSGRSCLALELDPAYVEASIVRWQAATGKQAVLQGPKGKVSLAQLQERKRR